MSPTRLPNHADGSTTVPFRYSNNPELWERNSANQNNAFASYWHRYLNEFSVVYNGVMAKK